MPTICRLVLTNSLTLSPIKHFLNGLLGLRIDAGRRDPEIYRRLDRSPAIIASIAAAEPSLALLGGKARALAVMARAGLPVPPGFLISTSAYLDFVESHGIRSGIDELLAELDADPTELERSGPAFTLGRQVRSAFHVSAISDAFAAEVEVVYRALGEHVAVAVRSSATAEDLPEASFAGQQESYLNVRGLAALLAAICDCWASLWSARAISYRRRQGVDQRAVAMGIVVQQMVMSDVSGVLFTANPVTGDRGELLVNASYGLGEAIVAGEVTPDTYVLDREHRNIKTTVIGEKQVVVVPADDQGTRTERAADARRSEPALSASLLHELAKLGLKLEALFDATPQDIEWALADGQLWLLQSRPITNLPLHIDADWEPPSEGEILIRRQVVENMPEPLSPLFEDLYLSIGLEEAIDQFLIDFKMRFDIATFLDRPFFLTVNGYAYSRGSYRFSWRLLPQIPGFLFAYVRVVPRLMWNMEARWRDESLPTYLQVIRDWEAIDLASADDAELRSGLLELVIADANYWFQVSILIAAAKITDGMLNRYLRCWFVPGDLTSGMFLRGFASKTIDAQVELESIATCIRRSESLRELCRRTPVARLPEAFDENEEAGWIADELRSYFDRYGHQVYNLDFAEPTLREDPTAVLLSLKTLVEIGGGDTPARHAEIIRERDALVERTSASLGPVRRWMFRKLLRWGNACGPRREASLFYMGAAWLTLRRLALELGRRLTDRGVVGEPSDVFFLRSEELQELCRPNEAVHQAVGLRSRVSERRELREARKRLHPPGIIPEGSCWKFGPLNMSSWETQMRNPAGGEQLRGFPVSPGRVTGVACVILSPADFAEMQPDSILVCPTTTPAWTPLLTHCRGLVTDIGGILAHGSIVAREYGIPAVLGTGNATVRIVSGQMITVDGDKGLVTLESSED